MKQLIDDREDETMKQLIDDLEALAHAADRLGMTGLRHTCLTRASMLEHHLAELYRLRNIIRDAVDDPFLLTQADLDAPNIDQRVMRQQDQMRAIFKQVDKVTEVLR